MGVVYHANYFVWFEIGRVELLRQLGFDYKQMELEDDCHLPVVEVNCRYRASAKYDDQVRIEARPVLLRGHVLRFSYRAIRIADDQLLAEAQSTHVICDHTMTKKLLPEKYAAALRSAIEETMA